MLDSFRVPAWVQNTIQRIVTGHSGEFSLVVLNDNEGKDQKTKQNTLVYSIFNRIDEKLFTKAPNPFATKNVANLLADVPIIKVVPQYKKDGWYLNEADVKIIREYQ